MTSGSRNHNREVKEAEVLRNQELQNRFDGTEDLCQLSLDSSTEHRRVPLNTAKRLRNVWNHSMIMPGSFCAARNAGTQLLCLKIRALSSAVSKFKEIDGMEYRQSGSEEN
ncbi:hypothetical protein OS493_025385 [Desmophyllum pertusum]|uniref:Uncharacterized protein n=1 Tax=Desmophyllum pertusum TaxID=174260 RepID=A0A9W9YY28_9CNID|nr:hypothetical protein OS493_025385 [Desmophyllum pertusum]